MATRWGSVLQATRPQTSSSEATSRCDSDTVVPCASQWALAIPATSSGSVACSPSACRGCGSTGAGWLAATAAKARHSPKALVQSGERSNPQAEPPIAWPPRSKRFPL